MPTPSNNDTTRLKPNRTGLNFSVELKISDTDVTKYLDSVRISNSMGNSWPTIVLTMSIDSDNIILQRVYGQEELKLTIYLSEEGSDIVDKVTFYLLYLQGNVSLVPKVKQSENQFDLQKTSFATVPIYAINLMGSFVNLLVEEEDSSIMPLDVIKNHLDQNGFRYDIDSRNKNENEPNQMIVPPMSFNKMIDYIDYHYGIFNGPIFRYCDHTGTFKMWDMSHRIKKAPVLTIVQISSAGMNDKEIRSYLDKTETDSRFFITRDQVDTLYHANTNILKYGYDVVQVCHPSNGLYNIRKSTSQQIVENYGLFNQDKTLNIHPNLKSRKTYFYSTSGDASIGAFASSTASHLARQSELQVTLYRNIKFENIFKIGEPIEFKPLTVEYLDYQGKYITYSSTYTLDRSSSYNWEAKCMLKMFRSNYK